MGEPSLLYIDQGEFRRESFPNMSEITSDGRIRGVETVAKMSPEHLYVFEFSFDSSDQGKRAFWYFPKKQELHGNAEEQARRYFQRIWVTQGDKVVDLPIEEDLAQQLRVFFTNFSSNELFMDETGADQNDDFTQRRLDEGGRGILDLIKKMVDRTIVE